MKNIYIYTRSAKVNSRDIEQQLNKCLKYSQTNDLKVCRIYCDIAESGNTLNRAGLRNLLSDCGNEDIYAVLVLRADRLTRNFRNYNLLLSKLKGKNVKLISVYEGDTSESSGLLVSKIFISMAEYKCTNINKKT